VCTGCQRWLWIFLLCLSTARAQNLGRVELQELSANGARSELKWKAVHSWKWVEGEEGSQVLFSKVELTPPSGFKLKTFKANRSVLSEDPSDQKAGAFSFLMPASTDGMSTEFENRQKVRFTTKVSLPAGATFERGCTTLDLGLKILGEAPASTWFGLACEKRDEKIRVTLTAPAGANWSSSSIFEIAGKGERWKLFEFEKIGKISQEKVLGTLNLEIQGRSVQVALIHRANFEEQKKAAIAAQNEKEVTKKSAELRNRERLLQQKEQVLNKKIEEVRQKSKEDYFLFRLGVGAGSVGLESQGDAASAVQPFLSFSGGSRPFFWGFSGGISLRYALPVSLSGNAQSFFDFQFFLARNFFPSGSFVFEPRVGLITLGQDLDTLGISFRHTNLLLSLFLKLGSQDRSGVWVDAGLSGQVPASESTYLSLGAGYEFYSSISARRWGFGGYFQSSEFPVAQSKFSQVLGVFYLVL
jgi:hypothetical protein